MLVRRGYGDPEEARAFLAGEQPLHDPFLLGDMARAVARSAPRSRRASASASTATTTSTASAPRCSRCLVLRELGADVEWHLPSRFDEGYGVSGETLERLAGEGCGLVLTVDCGITAVDEVRRARELGLEVIVTDHHRPGDELPGLPDRRDAAVRLSVPGALRHRRRRTSSGRRCSARTPRLLRRHLDLVALATIADVVPLARREPVARDRRTARARANAEAGAARR